MSMERADHGGLSSGGRCGCHSSSRACARRGEQDNRGAVRDGPHCHAAQAGVFGDTDVLAGKAVTCISSIKTLRTVILKRPLAFLFLLVLEETLLTFPRRDFYMIHSGNQKALPDGNWNVN